MQALEGIKVLDLSRTLAGPFSSMMLGDMGADIIKVEQPGSGDETRRFTPPTWNDVSCYYLSSNRNKRSITSVMGATVRSLTKQPITTINSTINFLAPLRDGDIMYAYGNVLQRGRSIVTAQGEIKDRNGTILAKTVGKFKVLKNRK